MVVRHITQRVSGPRLFASGDQPHNSLLDLFCYFPFQHINGEPYMVPNEVLLMLVTAGGPESKGKSAVITLLDWCDLDEQIVLVMERPVNCRSLINYMDHCPLQEALLKVRRLFGECLCGNVTFTFMLRHTCVTFLLVSPSGHHETTGGRSRLHALCRGLSPGYKV